VAPARVLCVLLAALALGPGARPSQVSISGVATCRLHAHCRPDQYCAKSSCFAVAEGFDVFCGVCRECSGCTTHQEAINRECPQRCGTPLYSTEYLSGLFYSVDRGGCLTMWRFEGFTFERCRTGLRYTALHKEAFGPPGPAECSDAGTQKGIFTLAPGDGGSTLALQVPTDLQSTYYEVSSGFVRQGETGLDIAWASGEDEERLLPLNNQVQEQDAELRREEHLRNPRSQRSWHGTLKVFDTECRVTLEMQRVPAPPNRTNDEPWVYTWRINTWDCIVGGASAPGMDEMDPLSNLKLSSESRVGTQRRRARQGKESMRRRLLAAKTNDEIAPPLAWPDGMGEWVPVWHENNATVRDFDFWHESVGNLSLLGCDIAIPGRNQLETCPYGAVCRGAIMRQYVYEWNLNKTGDLGSTRSPLAPSSFPFSAASIRGCTCGPGFAASHACTDSTLDDIQFVRPELRGNISHLFSNTSMVPRCTTASVT
jgi:hypothetical protein